FPLQNSGPITWLADTTTGVEPVVLLVKVTGPVTWLPERSSSPVTPLMLTGPMNRLSCICTTSAPVTWNGPTTCASVARSEAPAFTVTGPVTFAPSRQTVPSLTTRPPTWWPVIVWSQAGPSAATNRATPHRLVSWKHCPDEIGR